MTVRDHIVPSSEAMTELDIKKTKFYELVNSGDLDQVRLGAKSYVTRASLDRLVSKLLAQVGQPAAE